MVSRVKKEALLVSTPPFPQHPPTDTPTRSSRRGWVLPTVGLLTAGALAAGGLAWTATRDQDSTSRWEAFARVLPCERVAPFDLDGAEEPELPESRGVRAVTLEHRGLDTFTATFEYYGTPPNLPRQVVSPYSGEHVDAPGETTVNVLFSGADDATLSATGSAYGFTGGRLDTVLDLLDDPTLAPDIPVTNVVNDATVEGNELILTVNLEQQQDFFPSGAFTTDVQINHFVAGPITRHFPRGEPGPSVSQRCSWDNGAPTPPPQCFASHRVAASQGCGCTRP